MPLNFDPHHDYILILMRAADNLAPPRLQREPRFPYQVGVTRGVASGYICLHTTIHTHTNQRVHIANPLATTMGREIP